MDTLEFTNVMQIIGLLLLCISISLLASNKEILQNGGMKAILFGFTLIFGAIMIASGTMTELLEIIIDNF